MKRTRAALSTVHPVKDPIVKRDESIRAKGSRSRVNRRCRVAVPRKLYAVGLLIACSLGAVAGAEPDPPAVSKAADSDAVLFRVTASEGKPQPLPDDPPTWLFPQPVIAAGDPAETREVAELLVLRLSAEIEHRGLAQLVDRTKLDAILHERTENLTPAAPLDSYDALVRLKLDRSRLDRSVQLQVVALSTGASLGTVAVPWPVTEQSVEKMVELLQRAAPASTKPVTGRLRVRLMDAQAPHDQQRLQPLARKLRDDMAAFLGTAPNVQVMEHIEAATTKEEALLQLMGLSRLPGQRVFAPEADALIELRVQEVDAIDKTFEQTVLSAGLRRTVRGQPAEEWTESKATVSEFQGLARAVWSELQGKLSLPKSETPDDGEIQRTRRKQAFEEIRAAGRIIVPPGVPSQEIDELRRKKLEHLDTALKIDPTCEQAAYARLNMVTFGTAAETTRPGADLTEKPFVPLKEFIDYHDRFGTDATRAARQLNLRIGYRIITHEGLGAATPIEVAPLSDELLSGLMRTVETLVQGDPRHCLNGKIAPLLVTVDQNLRRREVPAASRDRWMDEQLAGLDRQVAVIDSWPANPHEESNRRFFQEQLKMTRLMPMKFALAEKRIERAEELFQQFRTTFAPKGPLHLVMKELADIVRAANSSRLKAAHAEWLEMLNDMPKERYLSIAVPPKPDLVISGTNIFPPWKPTFVLPGQQHFRSNNIYTDRMVPLAATADRLYVLLDELGPVETPQLTGNGSNSASRQRVAWIPCDKTGRPLGESETITDPVSGKNLRRWSTLQELPPFQWPAHQKPVLQCACVDGDRLFVGTRFHGLLVFDTKQQTWQSFGPEQGFPAGAVYSLVPTGDGRVLAAGDSYAGSGVHFVVSSQDLSVRLMYRRSITPPFTEAFPRRMAHVWRVGDEWWGFADGAEGWGTLWRGLGSADCRDATPNRKENTSRDLFKVRYDTTTGEIEFSNYKNEPTLRLKPDWFRCCGPTWQEILLGPLTASAPSTTDTALPRCVVVKSGHRYGDVVPVLVTEHGCWILRSQETVFLSTEDAARLAATAATEARKAVPPRPAETPVAQARLAFANGRPEQAVEVLHTLLEQQPDNFEALHWLAYLAEQPGVKTPADAMTYYERMAKLADNDAAFTGLMGQYRNARSRNDRKQELELEERLFTRFPHCQPVLVETLKSTGGPRPLPPFSLTGPNRPIFMLMLTNPFDPEPPFHIRQMTTPQK